MIGYQKFKPFFKPVTQTLFFFFFFLILLILQTGPLAAQFGADSQAADWLKVSVAEPVYLFKHFVLKK